MIDGMAEARVSFHIGARARARARSRARTADQLRSADLQMYIERGFL